MKINGEIQKRTIARNSWCPEFLNILKFEIEMNETINKIIKEEISFYCKKGVGAVNSKIGDLKRNKRNKGYYFKVGNETF